MFSLGQLAGTCVGRFPDMSRQAIGLTQQLEKTYCAELAANDRLSLEPFERAYPGRGKEMRDRNTHVASEPSRKAAAQYSREECENILSALEATITLNDWKMATLPAQTFFQQERARMPACR